MKEAVSYFGVPILFLALGAIFILLFAVIRQVLKEVSFFKGNTAVIIALCVSLLSTIGLSQLSAGGDGLREANNSEGRTGGILDFILLLYAALGITILLLLLLRFIAKIFRSERVKRYSEETMHCKKERPYTFDGSSKVSGETNEKTRIRK